MVFNDVAGDTRSGIIQNIEVMTDLGNAYITGDSSRLKEFTNLVNRVNHRVWHTIFTSNGNWQYDDGNYTDLPAAATDLVSGTAKYAIPFTASTPSETALTIQRVEAKDSSGNWYVVYPMTKEELTNIAVGEYMSSNGYPTTYRLVDNTIQLFPAPSYASSGGLKIYFDRDSVDFASTATTAVPGFASPYHEILPIGAAIEWLKVKQPTTPTLGLLMQDYLKLEASIKKFYGMRFKDFKPAIGRRAESFR